jgi:CHAT domain-containing protein/Tfp pilus assembly protein PilF
MYQQALAVLNTAPPPSSRALSVEIICVEGVADARLHNFIKSEEELGRALKLCQASEEETCGDLFRARGVLSMQEGDTNAAKQFFDRSLEFARSHDDQFLAVTALLNLGTASQLQGHFDEAVDWANRAHEEAESLGANGVMEGALGNLAWDYFNLGDLDRSLDLSLGAEHGADQVGEGTDQLYWITNIGYIYAARHELANARAYYLKALDLAVRIDAKEGIYNSLRALALVSVESGDLDDARKYSAEAIAIAHQDNNRLDELFPLLVRGMIAARSHDDAHAASIFREVESAPEAQATPSLRWRAQHELAQLQESEGHFAAAKADYETAIKTVQDARSEIKHEDSRLPFLSNATRIYDDYIHFLITQGKQDEALQTAASSRGRTLDEGLGETEKEQKLDAPALAHRFGGTILFYWLGQKQSYLWAITPQKSTLLPTLPPGAEIDAAVQRYRKTLIHGPGDVLASADADGQYLYRTLIAPAHAQLKKDAKVLVIPDGSLNNLNFETLLVPHPASALQPSAPQTQAKPHYWLEDATVVNGSSLRTRNRAHAPKSAAQSNPDRSLLLVGNSVAPSDQYPTLPQAAAQMQSVAQRFPASQEKILAQQNATPAAYLASNPERFNYIHFVAHGESRRLSPLDSFIVLSKAGAEEESFKLYARQIIDYHKTHPLHAELVTISACYSAGERAYSGEGLVGLSWAFLHAGAHNVIAALWDATDAPTEQLMDKFYDELNQGATPAAALHSAKLHLLQDSQFSNPLYWAPFQLYSRM